MLVNSENNIVLIYLIYTNKYTTTRHSEKSCLAVLQQGYHIPQYFVVLYKVTQGLYELVNGKHPKFLLTRRFCSLYVYVF